MTPKQDPKTRKGAGGRPRRFPISEKETLEKARALGRRNMLEVMQGWIDDLSAMEPVFYQGEQVAIVQNTTARAEARRQIADRCAFRFDPNEAPSDVGRALLEIFTKIDAGAKPGDG